MESLVRFLNGEMMSDIYGARLHELDGIEGPTDKDLTDPEFEAFLAKVLDDALDTKSAA